MPTGQAFYTNIRSQSDYFPGRSSAGMLLFEEQNIVDLQVWEHKMIIPSACYNLF